MGKLEAAVSDRLVPVHEMLMISCSTVSVAFTNGTLINVARVEASPRYNEVMKRLSNPSSVHPT